MPATHLASLEEQAQFYRKNGYAQMLNLIPGDEVQRMRRAMYRAIEKQKAARAEDKLKGESIRQGSNNEYASYYAKVFDQHVNLWQYDDEMKEIVQNPEFAEIARQLSGSKWIRLFHDHALIKRPHESKATNWHQDEPGMPVQPSPISSLTIWIALCDVHETKGCMQFIAGSQRLGWLPNQRLGIEGKIDLEILEGLPPIDKQRMRRIFQSIKAGEKPEELRIMEMPAGSATFHDGLTFHFAGPNLTDEPREALVIVYMTDQTNYSGEPNVMTDGLGLEVGKPFRGPQFPLLAGSE